jgi:PAS domain S-box-containing protein
MAASGSGDIGDASRRPGRPGLSIAALLQRLGWKFCGAEGATAGRLALQFALTYSAFATVWIFGGDYLLHRLVADVRLAADLQTAKGTAFVLATSYLIFVLVRSRMAAVFGASVTLRESVERLGFITENAKVGYSHWDAATKHIEWTAVGKRLAGIPPDERMTFARFLDAVHPDDRKQVNSAVRACLNATTRPSYHIEFRVIWPDGTQRWIEALGSATFDGNEPIRIAGISFDITERRQADDALRQSEARQRSLLEATSAMTWSCPPDGSHITPNAAWMEFTGQSASDMLGRGWSTAVHPEDGEDLAEAWDDCLARGVPHAATARCRRHDGEWRWMSVSAVPVRSASGEIVEWFGMHIDITERKELERRLKDALEAANAANDAKSQFVANMSHELRTPMGGVIGMLEVLLRTPLSDEQRDHVSTALKSARDLTHVLNDVLDVSAVEAGKVSIENRPFDMREMLSEKLTLFGARCAEKGITLTANVEGDVPQWIAGDVRRLCQVMHNLIGNAVKYTDGGKIDVIGRFDRERGRAHIEVRDTGIGIPEAMQANLFQRFYQADPTPSRPYGGSGLGLAICRQLVELMGGEIGASSSPGVGSTFWFEFPTLECDAPGDDQDSEAADTQTRSLRVLVAEDNLTAQRIIQTLLHSLGHDATIVNDGAPAVAAAASGAFDVILLDVMMPGMDGATATREIRALGGRAGGVPIIALTADVLFGKDQRYLSAGMTDYVSKPIDVALLAAALHRASAHTNFARTRA